MSEVRECNRNSRNPVQGVRALSFRARNYMANPTYFRPDGIWVFTGAQGSGKTLSAVQCAFNMTRRYPAARLITNIDVHGFDTEPERFTGYEMLSEQSNGVAGIIFLLDEVHLLWNSLESKNVPMSEMASFCQMRKARRVIIGTSQVYSRIAKPIREQLKYVWACHNCLGCLQYNDLIDPQSATEMNGHLVGADYIRRDWFFHSPEMYQRYETLELVKKPARHFGGANA